VLEALNEALRGDYRLRRALLLKRTDVTVQSLLWSPRVEGREGEVLAAVTDRRRALGAEPAPIAVADALAAGPELAWLATARVASTTRAAAVKAVRIPPVPDRGGRVHEMKPSASDLMPAWAARREGSGSPGGGGSGGRGGGGGWRGGGRGRGRGR
jgi:uncharacterized membrane protein YgcG